MWFLRLAKSVHDFFRHNSCLVPKSKVLLKLYYQENEFLTQDLNWTLRPSFYTYCIHANRMPLLIRTPGDYLGAHCGHFLWKIVGKYCNFWQFFTEKDHCAEPKILYFVRILAFYLQGYVGPKFMCLKVQFYKYFWFV